MKQLKLFLIGFTALCSIFVLANGKIVNCYYGTWANYRPGDGAFKPSNIDPNLCTHLSYSFFGIDESGRIKILDPWLDLAKDSGLDNINKTMALKLQNSKLKVIAVVGGWNEGSAKYSRMAADPKKRKTFIDSTLEFIRENGFDGMDLDWEYPAGHDSTNPEDKQNFVILLQEIYAALKPLNLDFGIAIGASVDTAHISYDIPNIAKNVDFINVMTYDFHTWEGGIFGSNTALRGDGKINVESSIRHLIELGAPPSKLILGLAAYGQTYKLANAQQFKLGSTTVGAGKAGPYTSQPGFLGYNEICVQKNQWSYYWDELRSIPCLTQSTEAIVYDEPKSIELKVDLANTLNLEGVMIWSIETDDFLGKCGPKYPILNAIKNKLGNRQDMRPSGYVYEVPEAPMVVEESNIAATYLQPVNEDIVESLQRNTVDNGGDACSSSDGFYRHESDCSRYYQCVGGTRYDFNCSSGLVFDTTKNVCNWPALVQC